VIDRHECCLLTSDTAWTLSMLLEHLSPHMSQLNVLSHVYASGIEACSSVSSASYKASHLLEELFSVLTDLGNLRDERHQLV